MTVKGSVRRPDAPRFYVIAATVTRERDGWTSSRQLPTFLLDARIQGITGITHAEHVATGLLRDAAGDDAELSVSAYVMEGEA